MTSSKSLLKYFVSSFAIKVSLILAVLFFMLTPGVILSVPPKPGCSNWVDIPFMNNTPSSCKADLTQALVHSIVFGIVTYLIITQVFKRR